MGTAAGKECGLDVFAGSQELGLQVKMCMAGVTSEVPGQEPRAHLLCSTNLSQDRQRAAAAASSLAGVQRWALCPAKRCDCFWPGSKKSSAVPLGTGLHLH